MTSENSVIDLEKAHPDFRFDIRYARTDNFIKQAVYDEACAFLLSHVVQDLIAVQEDLKPQGFGLLIFDAYRPWSVTETFWNLSDEHDRKFLADPAKGSVHNRGCAVDLTLYELRSGQTVQMPSEFDEMNEKAYLNYAGGDEKSRKLRDLLQFTMNLHGFSGIPNEWWHFNHHTLKDWPILNLSFKEIKKNLEKTVKD